jgi:hypothetical protein
MLITNSAGAAEALGAPLRRRPLSGFPDPLKYLLFCAIQPGEFGSRAFHNSSSRTSPGLDSKVKVSGLGLGLVFGFGIRFQRMVTAEWYLVNATTGS